MTELNSTNKKSNKVDQFSREYQRLEDSIKIYQEKKDKLSKLIREQELQFDIEKRKYLSHAAIFNEKISAARTRKKNISSQLPDFDSASRENNLAQLRNSKLLNEVDTLKKQLVVVYQKIADTLSQTFDSNVESEIPKLNSNISKLKKMIEQRNAQKLNNQQTYSSLQKNYEDIQKKEEEYNNLKNEINEKENQIDNRRIRALQIMAEPIDSLTYEEDMTKEAEKDANNAEERFSNKATINDIDFSNELENVTQLESENTKRKAIITKKRISIAELKNSIKNINKLDNIITKNENKKDRKIEIKDDIQTQDMHELVEQISLRLQKKQKEVDEEERKIDQLSAQNALLRKQKTYEWEQQMKKIEELNQNYHEIETLLLHISEVTEQNDEEKQTLSELETKIAQLKRRIENALRDQKSNSTNSQRLQMLREKYENRKKEVEENDKRIEEMKESYEELQNFVKDAEKGLKERESEVIKLEDQIKTIEVRVSETVQKLHDEESKLDDLLKKLPKEQLESEGISDILNSSGVLNSSTGLNSSTEMI